MTKRCLCAALLVLTGCQRSDTKVLIGATTIVAPGAAPIEDSVIVAAGSSIRYVGMRKDAAIPQDSERVNLSGKWITPEDGGRIALSGPATLLVREGSASGNISRVLINGRWQQ